MRATHTVSTRERRDDDSDSVRHGQVSAMLLNEFLKEHQAVQEVKKVAAVYRGPKGSAQNCAVLQQKFRRP
jgi:hypothetical protein